jgi:lipopolysaccharide heptosyltransferase II
MMRGKKLENIKSILIIGLSSIGDNLLISPVIKLIQEKYPDASIDIVVGPRAIDFAKDNPVFSNFYVWDKSSGILTLKRMMKNQQYDMIVDFRNSFIPFFLSGKFKLTCFKREFFSDKFSTHESERTLQLFKSYFGMPEKIELYFPLKNEEIQQFKKSLHDIIDFEKKDKIFVLNPGAAFEKKRWKKENFAETGKKIISKYGGKILIVGNNKEFELAEEIRQKINSEKALNLAGKISFRCLAYILSESSLLITNDTGTMHLASAMKCPIIAIFGPGNPHRYGPIGTKNIVLHTRMDCFPCILESKCKKNFVCMNDVSVEDVMNAVSQILNQHQ